MKRVAQTLKLILPIWKTHGYVWTHHGKHVQRRRHGGQRIHEWGVISRVSSHLHIGSWHSIDRTGSIGVEVPTFHCETWLRDMTYIKLICRQRGHGAPGSNARVHISGPGRGLKRWRHINRKMIRDPRHGLSIIILHTITKSRWIFPHEMSEHRGGDSSKWGSQRKSIIHDNENSA